MTRETKEREKMPVFRMSQETIANARIKFGAESEEFTWLDNVATARIPFVLLGDLTQQKPEQIRDMLSGRRSYTDEGRAKMRQANKLIERGLDVGLFPCSDLAVIKPVAMTLLRCMLLEKQNELLKQANPQ